MSNKESITISKDLLVKFASFIDMAVKHIGNLTDQLESANSLVKSAQTKDKSKYNTTVVKVAQLIGNSDMEYLIEGYDKSTFLKKASQDPDYLVATLNSMLNVVDPIGLGKTASVKSVTHSKDPVYARAFGISQKGSSFMFDD